MVRAPEQIKKLWIALILSGTYLVLEIVGGIVSGSLALLADAGHMAIDVAALGLGLFALWISSRPPTDEKTYGYYRAEILAALVNGAALVAIAVWIAYEAWDRMKMPPRIEGGLMTVVAAGGLVINLISLGLLRRHSHDNLNLKGVFLHLVSDTLGSISVLVAGFLIWAFGWYWTDIVGSIGIALLIVINSFKLLGECVNVLLEGVPKDLEIAKIKCSLQSCPSVRSVHDLHVWTMTSGLHALSAHIVLEQDINHGKALDTLTTLLRDEYKIEHVTLQLEPTDFTHPHLHF
ncbi:MAG: cation transporter [Deltaproteobacteria bacterium]|nr:cation transporter [Deltaproteobacteria bacterium]